MIRAFKYEEIDEANRFIATMGGKIVSYQPTVFIVEYELEPSLSLGDFRFAYHNYTSVPITFDYTDIPECMEDEGDQFCYCPIEVYIKSDLVVMIDYLGNVLEIEMGEKCIFKMNGEVFAPKVMYLEKEFRLKKYYSPLSLVPKIIKYWKDLDNAIPLTQFSELMHRYQTYKKGTELIATAINDGNKKILDGIEDIRRDIRGAESSILGKISSDTKSLKDHIVSHSPSEPTISLNNGLRHVRVSVMMERIGRKLGCTHY